MQEIIINPITVDQFGGVNDATVYLTKVLAIFQETLAHICIAIDF